MTDPVEQALHLMLAQNQSRWRKPSMPEPRKSEQEPRYSYRGYTPNGDPIEKDD